MFHRYVEIFVKIFEPILPWEVPFWRPDNREGLFAWRWKPLGYWVGHAVAYVILAAVVVTLAWAGWLWYSHEGVPATPFG